MSGEEIIYILQCCSANEKYDRGCSQCPLRGNRYCHTELCEILVQYVMHEQGKSERMTTEIENLRQAVSNMAKIQSS